MGAANQSKEVLKSSLLKLRPIYAKLLRLVLTERDTTDQNRNQTRVQPPLKGEEPLGPAQYPPCNMLLAMLSC